MVFFLLLQILNAFSKFGGVILAPPRESFGEGSKAEKQVRQYGCVLHPRRGSSSSRTDRSEGLRRRLANLRRFQERFQEGNRMLVSEAPEPADEEAQVAVMGRVPK